MCHCAEALSVSLLKCLLKGEGAQQNDSLAEGYSRSVTRTPPRRRNAALAMSSNRTGSSSSPEAGDGGAEAAVVVDAAARQSRLGCHSGTPPCAPPLACAAVRAAARAAAPPARSCWTMSGGMSIGARLGSLHTPAVHWDGYELSCRRSSICRRFPPVPSAAAAAEWHVSLNHCWLERGRLRGRLQCVDHWNS